MSNKPAKLRKHRPISPNRCLCKWDKLFGKPTIQDRKASKPENED